MRTSTDYLYQNSQNATNFLSKKHCAGPGILEKIHFVQWHIFDMLRHQTTNVRLINYASLLAVFPRMGIFAIEIPQSLIAEKMGELFGCVPTRQTISKWECQLQEMGYLQIPRHVDWQHSSTKIRVITEKFWNISRRGLEKLSYSCPHATLCCGKFEEVKHVTPEDPNNNNSVIQIRAREVSTDRQASSRAESVLNKKSVEKRTTPPKNKTGRPKQLNRFENSIMHWLFQSRKLSSYREGVILFGQFLSQNRDEYYSWLKKCWRECGDSQRPGLVRDLIDRMRMVPDVQEDTVPPLQLAEQRPDLEHISVLNAMLLGYEYEGPCNTLIKRFRGAGRDEQDEILAGIDELILACKKSEKN